MLHSVECSRKHLFIYKNFNSSVNKQPHKKTYSKLTETFLAWNQSKPRNLFLIINPIKEHHPFPPDLPVAVEKKLAKTTTYTTTIYARGDAVSVLYSLRGRHDNSFVINLIHKHCIGKLRMCR